MFSDDGKYKILCVLNIHPPFLFPQPHKAQSVVFVGVVWSKEKEKESLKSFICQNCN